MSNNKPKRLEFVEVPQNCSVSWDSMTGTDRARMCAVCGRQVHDLSVMTASEVESLLFDREDNRVCVRLARGSDGHVITADRPNHYSYRHRSLAGISIAALATFLGLSEPRGALAAAQRSAQQVVTRQPASGAQRPNKKRDGMLSGTVHTLGADFAEATVVAINEQNGEEFSTETGAEGRYHIALPKGTYLVSVTSSIFIPYAVGGFKVGRASRLNATLRFPCMGECVAVPDNNSPTGFGYALAAPLKAIKKLLKR
jgi:carboxypeptidase family protein